MNTDKDRDNRSTATCSGIWPRSPKRRRGHDESPQRFRPDSRHIVLDRDRAAKNGTIFSLGHGRSVNILFVEAGDYVDIRTCPEKNCDLVFAENEFGMKAHISPTILALDEVRFYCVFCSNLINFESEGVLNKHIVDAHFFAKFEKGLKKKPPYNCPFSFCRFNGKSQQDLVYHYAGPEHHVFQKILTKAKYDLILKQNRIDDSGGETSLYQHLNKKPCFFPIQSFVPPRCETSFNAPSKEIEAKAFNQMYTDEKIRADKLQNEVDLLGKEVEGLKREWQEARAQKRAKENEAKEWKLKYDVIRSKNDSDAYGRNNKSPLKYKEEKANLKQEIKNLNQQAENLSQQVLNLEEKIMNMTKQIELLTKEKDTLVEKCKTEQKNEVDSSQNVGIIEKRSRSRLIKLRRQKKAMAGNEIKIQELQNQLDFTERQFATLEKKKLELENINSAIELELKSESDQYSSKISKLEEEKADLKVRLQTLEVGSKELQDTIDCLKKEKESLEQRLEDYENQIKCNGELNDKLKEQVDSCGKLAQVNTMLKKDNEALEKRVNTDTEGVCQTLQVENVILRRQLEKYKASLSLRDQEIQLLRQFDEEDKFNPTPTNFVKNEQFK